MEISEGLKLVLDKKSPRKIKDRSLYLRFLEVLVKFPHLSNYVAHKRLERKIRACLDGGPSLKEEDLEFISGFNAHWTQEELTSFLNIMTDYPFLRDFSKTYYLIFQMPELTEKMCHYINYFLIDFNAHKEILDMLVENDKIPVKTLYRSLVEHCLIRHDELIAGERILAHCNPKLHTMLVESQANLKAILKLKMPVGSLASAQYRVKKWLPLSFAQYDALVKELKSKKTLKYKKGFQRIRYI